MSCALCYVALSLQNITLGDSVLAKQWNNDGKAQLYAKVEGYNDKQPDNH